MANTLEQARADPPKCPSCKDVQMDEKDVELHELTEGGTIHWVCKRCGLHLVRVFE